MPRLFILPSSHSSTRSWRDSCFSAALRARSSRLTIRSRRLEGVHWLLLLLERPARLLLGVLEVRALQVLRDVGGRAARGLLDLRCGLVYAHDHEPGLPRLEHRRHLFSLVTFHA